ncbi:MAG: hypothetical protein AAGD22_07925 [Verrucomicrobiota bacterium]
MKRFLSSILLCLALMVLPASHTTAGPVLATPISTEEATALTEQEAASLAELEQIIAGDDKKTVWVGLLILAAVATAAAITASQ